MWDKKARSTSFFSVTFTNVKISPKNFLKFKFNPFAIFLIKFQSYTWCQSQNQGSANLTFACTAFRARKMVLRGARRKKQ